MSRSDKPQDRPRIEACQVTETAPRDAQNDLIQDTRLSLLENGSYADQNSRQEEVGTDGRFETLRRLPTEPTSRSEGQKTSSSHRQHVRSTSSTSCKDSSLYPFKTRPKQLPETPRKIAYRAPGKHLLPLSEHQPPTSVTHHWSGSGLYTCQEPTRPSTFRLRKYPSIPHYTRQPRPHIERAG